MEVMVAAQSGTLLHALRVIVFNNIFHRAKKGRSLGSARQVFKGTLRRSVFGNYLRKAARRGAER